MDVHWPCHDVIKFAWSRKRKVAKTHLLFKMKWACLVSYPFLIKMNKIFQITLSKCSNISILPRFGRVKHLRTTFPHRIWDVRVMTSFNDIKVTLLSSWYAALRKQKKIYWPTHSSHSFLLSLYQGIEEVAFKPFIVTQQSNCTFLQTADQNVLTPVFTMCLSVNISADPRLR